jgi:pilus assembly protein Flp/PilA
LAPQLLFVKRTCLEIAGINQEDNKMNDLILKVYVKGQNLWSTLKDDEKGQDLVEYGLVIVLVCLAATAGMNTLAQGINNAMTNISTKLGTYTAP